MQQCNLLKFLVSFFTVHKTTCCNLTCSAPDDGRMCLKHVELMKLQYVNLSN